MAIKMDIEGGGLSPEELAAIEEEKRKEQIDKDIAGYGKKVDPATGQFSDSLKQEQVPTVPSETNLAPQTNQTDEAKIEDFKKLPVEAYPEKNIYPNYKVPTSMPGEGTAQGGAPGDYKPDEEKILKTIKDFYGDDDAVLPKFQAIEDPKAQPLPENNTLRLIAAGARDLSDIFGYKRDYKNYTGAYVDSMDAKRSAAQKENLARADKVKELNTKKMEQYVELYKQRNEKNKNKFGSYKDMMTLGLDQYKDFEKNRVEWAKQRVSEFQLELNAASEKLKAQGAWTKETQDAFKNLSDNFNNGLKNKIELFGKLNDSKNSIKNGDLEKTKFISGEMQNLHNSKEWKDHEEIGQAVASFVRARNNGAGDLSRAYAFIKTRDPNAVREGEMNNLAAMRGWFASARGKGFMANLKAAGSHYADVLADLATGDNRFAPEDRDAMLTEVLSTYNSRRKSVLNSHTGLMNFLNKRGLNDQSIVAPMDYSKDWKKIVEQQRLLDKRLEEAK